MQIMMLLFTYAPIGSAFATALRYSAASGANVSSSPTEKPRIPRPLRPAISQLDVLPAAYHIAGCGFT